MGRLGSDGGIDVDVDVDEAGGVGLTTLRSFYRCLAFSGVF